MYIFLCTNNHDDTNHRGFQPHLELFQLLNNSKTGHTFLCKNNHDNTKLGVFLPRLELFQL